MKRHGRSPIGDGEFTLCGLAYDAHDSGDWDEEILFAKTGQTITCEECRKAIRDMRHYKLDFKQP